MRYIIALVFVLFARPVLADPAPWIWASTCAIDWGTTYYGVTHHGPAGMIVGQHYVQETNPTISWLQDTPALMVTVGAGIDVASWAVLRKVDRRHHRLATVAYYGLAGYRSYLVAKTLHAISIADQPLVFQRMSAIGGQHP